jgi:hypothetical protein
MLQGRGHPEHRDIRAALLMRRKKIGAMRRLMTLLKRPRQILKARNLGPAKADGR